MPKISCRFSLFAIYVVTSFHRLSPPTSPFFRGRWANSSVDISPVIDPGGGRFLIFYRFFQVVTVCQDRSGPIFGGWSPPLTGSCLGIKARGRPLPRRLTIFPPPPIKLFHLVFSCHPARKEPSFSLFSLPYNRTPVFFCCCGPSPSQGIPATPSCPF